MPPGREDAKRPGENAEGGGEPAGEFAVKLQWNGGIGVDLDLPNAGCLEVPPERPASRRVSRQAA